MGLLDSDLAPMLGGLLGPMAGGATAGAVGDY